MRSRWAGQGTIEAARASVRATLDPHPPPGPPRPAGARPARQAGPPPAWRQPGPAYSPLPLHPPLPLPYRALRAGPALLAPRFA